MEVFVMSGIGSVNNSYSSYISNYGKTANNGRNKTNETEVVENKSNVKNTNSTDDYVKQLREKFSKYNITVGNFDNLYASQKGTNNLVLDPKLVEKMANDPKFAAEMEVKINRAMTQGVSMVRNGLASNGAELTMMVYGFNEDGLANGASASRRSSGNTATGPNLFGSNGTNQTGNMFDKMKSELRKGEKLKEQKNKKIEKSLKNKNLKKFAKEN